MGSDVTTPFSRTDLLSLTSLPNLKLLCLPTTKTWKVMQNVDIGVVWGQGHPRSLALLPFN